MIYNIQQGWCQLSQLCNAARCMWEVEMTPSLPQPWCCALATTTHMSEQFTSQLTAMTDQLTKLKQGQS